MVLHLQSPQGAYVTPEQSRSVTLSGHTISHSPFDQTDAYDSSHIHPDIIAPTAIKTINLIKVSTVIYKLIAVATITFSK